MKLLMHVLKENKKLNIDNTKIGSMAIIIKLDEEFKEVVKAMMNYSKEKTLNNLKEVIAETFDLIQICILILWRCHRQALDFNEADIVKEINIAHKDKLVKRQWIFETGIEIDVKE
ncbi:MAG: hypothetical protein KHZ99_14075 [Clostridium sp.]|uniref:hypothetical protein n=1 Tax=Clostridium sp. TaxID=1506 RepID=UPI0025C44250|nr:hypothetical protein [Clostridium sp.]MBS4958159.1 hypothetical protein [Clostridium sp.]